MLSQAGAPRIVDVGDFILMSDQKKIDMLFSLYPPAANLTNLDNLIENAKTRVNDLQASERTMTATIQKLTASRLEIQVPAGSLPEIKADIEATTKQILDARESLKQIEIDDAKESAKAEQKVDSQTAFDAIMEKKTVDYVPHEISSNDDKEPEKPVYEHNINSNMAPGGRVVDAEFVNPAESIQRIIDTIIEADCGACAALLIAKFELKKFRGAK
jgi:hypothetical protein